MKKYIVCGVSNRALNMFIKPLLNRFSSTCRLVALLDSDKLRFKICKEQHPKTDGLPEYLPEEFDKMVAECEPDAVIVTGPDFTHVQYIIKALKHNLDVICEKPMVTNCADCRLVLDAEKESAGRVIVTFNYRYQPTHRCVKEQVVSGKLGKVTSVDFNWYVDTYHGASYFQRWNRKRENSGGLSIHKSTHHFDLVNWWLGQRPVDVFAFGSLNYYGSNGVMNPEKKPDRHCASCESFDFCAYKKRWLSRTGNSPADDHLASFRPHCYSNYTPDACIFDEEINIEDTYVATVRYDQGALLSYSINFSSPVEGYSLAINGTEGRLETRQYGVRTPFPVPEQTIAILPLFGSAKEEISVLKREGGHGGGDPELLEDIFGCPDDISQANGILAGTQAAVDSIAIGEAVWRSSQKNRRFSISELLGMHLTMTG